VWYVQMSPDVVLECQECGRGSADSCMTMGNGSYIYLQRYIDCFQLSIKRIVDSTTPLNNKLLVG